MGTLESSHISINTSKPVAPKRKGSKKKKKHCERKKEKERMERKEDKKKRKEKES
jgi:hypothetical protein